MAAALVVSVLGCGQAGPPVTRIQTRPTAPTRTIDLGEHVLGMSTFRLRDLEQRDGLLYVPTQAAEPRPLPLIVLLHGGGGRAEDFRALFPLADEFGVTMLAIDSRHNTWDGIDSPFGPDVQFIDTALRYTFERVSIDPGRIALGGLSDGGAYSLSLGLVNGDLFTHLVAVAPGYYAPPAPPEGRPRIFVAHGTRDTVYRVAGSRTQHRTETEECRVRCDLLRIQRTALDNRGCGAPRAAMVRALSKVNTELFLSRSVCSKFWVWSYWVCRAQPFWKHSNP